MKALLFFFALSLSATPPASLLVIDMNGKKPPQPANHFSIEQYLSRSFPVYAQDMKILIDATYKAAKIIDNRPACNAVDTVRVNHTLIIVHTQCANGKKYTVRYVTRIDEQNFLCDFELIKNEVEPRTAQAKLLDFAAYLSQ